MNIFQIVLDLFRRPAQESTKSTSAPQEVEQVKINIRDYVTTFSRTDIRSGFSTNESLMILPQVFITMPDAFLEATHEMCMLAERETRGVLVCKKYTNGNMLVEAILTLGYGSPYAVYVDSKKQTALQKFSEIHPEFFFCEFHSHTETTGEAFYNGFLSSDFTTLARKINSDNEYTHVLFTPTNVCTFGFKKPRFIACKIKEKNDDELIYRHMEIHGEFEALCV